MQAGSTEEMEPNRRFEKGGETAETDRRGARPTKDLAEITGCAGGEKAMEPQRRREGCEKSSKGNGGRDKGEKRIEP